jgi:hypothetical protein
MNKNYWLASFLMPLLLTSCDFYNKIFGTFIVQKTPDTLVLSIDPECTELQYLSDDSTYAITRYWMDGYGNRLYKSLDERFRRGALHGERQEWSKMGLLIHQSNWDRGTKIDSLREWYDSTQQLKKYIQFDSIGNMEFEMNFHKNGKRASDTIVYIGGRRNGQINFYDEEGSKTQTYVYRNDTLLYVEVFKKMYYTLEGMAFDLAKRRKEDSIKIINDTTPKNIIAIEDDDW